MDAHDELSIFNADWHGCGDRRAGSGATMLLDQLFADAPFVRYPAPEPEASPLRNDVRSLASIASRTAAVLDDLRRRAPARLFHLGATCGTEFAPIAWLNERYAGDLAVVWLDAHADLNTPASSPSKRFHGMVLRTLAGDGAPELVGQLGRPLEARQMFLAGARDLDPPERDYVEAAGVAVTTVADLATPERLYGRIRERGFAHAYVHLDLDVLDPIAFPDALVRTPNGASADIVAAQIRALIENVDVVGFSLVEFVSRTPGGVTAVASLLRQTGVAIGAMRVLPARH